MHVAIGLLTGMVLVGTLSMDVGAESPLSKRLTALENRVDRLKADLAALEAQAATQEDVMALEDRLTTLEERVTMLEQAAQRLAVFDAQNNEVGDIVGIDL